MRLGEFAKISREVREISFQKAWGMHIMAMGSSRLQAMNCLDMFHLGGGCLNFAPFSCLKI